MVGIDTTAPDTQLHVVMSGATSAGRGIMNALHYDGTNAAAYKTKRSRGTEATPTALLSGDSAGAINIFSYDSSSYQNTASIIFNVNGTVSTGTVPTDTIFYNGVSSTNRPERMRITAAGNVGIGTATPAYALDVNGVIRGSNVSPSDIRWKKNIEPISNAMSLVQGLQGVRFDWRSDEFAEKKFPEGRQVGLIAQDIEKVVPEVVTTDFAGYKAISYDKLTAVLVEAIKEQQAEIKELKNEI
jgi:hypothetical protein